MDGVKAEVEKQVAPRIVPKDWKVKVAILLVLQWVFVVFCLLSFTIVPVAVGRWELCSLLHLPVAFSHDPINYLVGIVIMGQAFSVVRVLVRDGVGRKIVSTLRQLPRSSTVVMIQIAFKILLCSVALGVVVLQIGSVGTSIVRLVCRLSIPASAWLGMSDGGGDDSDDAYIHHYFDQPSSTGVDTYGSVTSPMYRMLSVMYTAAGELVTTTTTAAAAAPAASPAATSAGSVGAALAMFTKFVLQMAISRGWVSGDTVDVMVTALMSLAHSLFTATKVGFTMGTVAMWLFCTGLLRDVCVQLYTLPFFGGVRMEEMDRPRQAPGAAAGAAPPLLPPDWRHPCMLFFHDVTLGLIGRVCTRIQMAHDDVMRPITDYFYSYTYRSRYFYHNSIYDNHTRSVVSMFCAVTVTLGCSAWWYAFSDSNATNIATTTAVHATNEMQTMAVACAVCDIVNILVVSGV